MRAVDQPNWRPLETLADTAAGMMLLSPDDFMWMGRVQTTSGVEVELYKLYGINHHVNVDHAGRASRYEPGNGSCAAGATRSLREDQCRDSTCAPTRSTPGTTVPGVPPDDCARRC